MRVQSEREFAIQHYAGWIMYSCTDFIDKNRDTLYESIRAELRRSDCELLVSLFPSEDGAAEAAAAVAGADSVAAPSPRRKAGELQATLAMQFRDEMAKLMETIRATTPLYIRCIKPNRCGPCVWLCCVAR